MIFKIYADITVLVDIPDKKLTDTLEITGLSEKDLNNTITIAAANAFKTTLPDGAEVRRCVAEVVK